MTGIMGIHGMHGWLALRNVPKPHWSAVVAAAI
jgi:hypothetical protein